MGRQARRKTGPAVSFFGPGGAARATIMTLSADEDAAAGDVLERSREMYRDLSVALSERIARLRSALGIDAECRDSLEAVKAHQRILNTVLDLEACLVKRSRSSIGGSGVELDLDAARTEIAARLAVWLARG